jgi:hypothetical protein
MKNSDREKVKKFVDLPNIGEAMAADLQLIGIDHPKKLIGKDPLILPRWKNRRIVLSIIS